MRTLLARDIRIILIGGHYLRDCHVVMSEISRIGGGGGLCLHVCHSWCSDPKRVYKTCPSYYDSVMQFHCSVDGCGIR